MHRFAICISMIGVLAPFQGAQANDDERRLVLGCPAGHAVQALDRGRIRCIPVPPPTDLAPVNTAIAAETAAREGADGVLTGLIANETAARQAADAELRVLVTESSIAGRYAITGVNHCLNSSLGFTPGFAPAPPPPLPLPPAPPTSATPNVVSVTSGSTWGYATFNADGTGSIEFTTTSIVEPGNFYSALSSGVTTTNPNPTTGTRGPTGFIAVQVNTGPFTWHVEGDRLIVEGIMAASGTIVAGSTNPGWTIFAENAPPFFGIIGKDARLISMNNLGVAVEVNVQRSPDGTVETRGPRMCHRERLLRKL